MGLKEQLFDTVLQSNIGKTVQLISLGAKHDISDGSGNLPIHLAAQRGYQDIVKVLLREDIVNKYNYNGLTPLHTKDGNTALIFVVKRIICR